MVVRQVYTDDYEGDDRRNHQSWKINKSIDLGHVITLIGVLLGMMGLASKLESRITAVETKVQFIIDGRIK